MAAQYAAKLPAKNISEQAVIPAEAARLLDQLTKQELGVDAAVAKLASTPYLSFKELQNAQTEVRNMLKRCAASLKDANEIADAQDSTKDRTSILGEITRHSQKHAQLQIDIRKASLSAADDLKKREEDERNQLLSGAATAEQLRQRRSKNDAVLDASNQLTDAMRSAVQMLSVEVERSAQANMVLDEGTQIMAKTSSEYKLYNSVIRTSKELINGIASRDWTDRLLILFGFLVFLLTVIYVVRRRLWFIPSFSWLFDLLLWPFKRILSPFRMS